MNFPVPAFQLRLLGLDVCTLAVSLPNFNEEVGFLLGAALTVLGTMLQWQAPRQRMSAEERMKDGKLTEVQAARMIRFYKVSGPVLTVAGGGLMIWALSRYLA